MNIAGMNIRITIQKNEIVKDKYGNHTNAWTDFFTCWATPVQSGGSEKQEAGTTNSTEALHGPVCGMPRRARLHEAQDPTRR